MAGVKFEEEQIFPEIYNFTFLRKLHLAKLKEKRNRQYRERIRKEFVAKFYKTEFEDLSTGLPYTWLYDSYHTSLDKLGKKLQYNTFFRNFKWKNFLTLTFAGCPYIVNELQASFYMRKFINRIKSYFRYRGLSPKFDYCWRSEFGPDTGRLHIHMLHNIDLSFLANDTKKKREEWLLKRWQFKNMGETTIINCKELKSDYQVQNFYLCKYIKKSLKEQNESKKTIHFRTWERPIGRVFSSSRGIKIIPKIEKTIGLKGQYIEAFGKECGPLEEDSIIKIPQVLKFDAESKMYSLVEKETKYRWVSTDRVILASDKNANLNTVPKMFFDKDLVLAKKFEDRLRLSTKNKTVKKVDQLGCQQLSLGIYRIFYEFYPNLVSKWKNSGLSLWNFIKSQRMQNKRVDNRGNLFKWV